MMKKLSLMAGILGVLAFLMAPPSWAQQSGPGPPGGPGNPGRPAGPQALQSPGRGDSNGESGGGEPPCLQEGGKPDRVAMVLQTNQGAVKVHLGPADYLDQQALKLAVGDQVEVKGVKVSRLKAPTFIAGEVRKGDQVLKLRDDATGRPLWLKGKKRNGAT